MGLRSKTFILLFALIFTLGVYGAEAEKVTWAKTYGGSDYDHAQSIQQTRDGGLLRTCMTENIKSTEPNKKKLIEK